MAPLLSSLTNLIETSFSTSQSPHSLPHQALTIQVSHNLQFQHDWTSLTTHTASTIPLRSLSRPLLSGYPPHRIYIHPDDQVEMLKRGEKETDLRPQREWVLPTHLREKWSLRKLAEVFDAVEEIPVGSEDNSANKDGKGTEKRRGGKRLLMAIVGDDSTVVYYIIHDGIVKPRQN